MRKSHIILLIIVLLTAVQAKAESTGKKAEILESNNDVELLDISIMDERDDAYILMSYERYKSGNIAQIDVYKLDEMVKTYYASRQFEKASFGYWLLALVCEERGDSENMEVYVTNLVITEKAIEKAAKRESRKMEAKWIKTIVLMSIVIIVLVVIVVNPKKRRGEETEMEILEEELSPEEKMAREAEEQLRQKIEKLKGRDLMSKEEMEREAESLFGKIRENNPRVSDKAMALLLVLCMEGNIKKNEASEWIGVGRSQFFALKKVLHETLGMSKEANNTAKEYIAAVTRYLTNTLSQEDKES